MIGNHVHAHTPHSADVTVISLWGHAYVHTCVHICTHNTHMCMHAHTHMIHNIACRLAHMHTCMHKMHAHTHMYTLDYVHMLAVGIPWNLFQVSSSINLSFGDFAQNIFLHYLPGKLPNMVTSATHYVSMATVLYYLLLCAQHLISWLSS